MPLIRYVQQVVLLHVSDATAVRLLLGATVIPFIKSPCVQSVCVHLSRNKHSILSSQRICIHFRGTQSAASQGAVVAASNSVTYH
jgi:hypothetical protein